MQTLVLFYVFWEALDITEGSCGKKEILLIVKIIFKCNILFLLYFYYNQYNFIWNPILVSFIHVKHNSHLKLMLIWFKFLQVVSGPKIRNLYNTYILQIISIFFFILRTLHLLGLLIFIDNFKNKIIIKQESDG